MRSLILFTALTSVAFIAVANAQGPQGGPRGLNKHDASIANYGYTIPIQTDTDSGDGNLKDDLDKGLDSKAAITAPPAHMGAPMGATTTATISPAAIGTQAPEFSLPSFVGGNVALKNLLARGPLLVLFTPGTATPRGLMPLQLIQKNLRQFEALGITVVAITPEPLPVLQMAQQAHNFAFHILNDQNNAVSTQYGVLQGYEPVPTLFSIDAAGNIAGVQILQQANAIFDLRQATDPLRGQTQPAIAAPVPAPAGIVPDTDMTAPVIPAVPSPQTNRDIPPSNVPKISYDVPPSNPAFNGKPAPVGLAI